MKKEKNAETGDKHEKSADTRRGVREWLVGIDEVGRGPLAGPVTVGAVAIVMDGADENTYEKLRKKLMEISGEIGGGTDAKAMMGGIKKEYPIGVDSKKMKESDRDFWYEVILKLMESGDLRAVASSLSAGTIDKKGIAVCIKELVDHNLKKISKKDKDKDMDSSGAEKDLIADIPFAQMHVLLDGGLKTGLGVGSQKTIVKGDEKELLISLASVYAKVTRDTHMKNLSKNSQYSAYGFDVHKGYGTLKHREVMKKHGLSDEHRKSFCKNFK